MRARACVCGCVCMRVRVYVCMERRYETEGGVGTQRYVTFDATSQSVTKWRGGSKFSILALRNFWTPPMETYAI